MKQENPTKQQVFEAFTNTIEFEYNISDEIEVLMLDAIQTYKKGKRDRLFAQGDDWHYLEEDWSTTAALIDKYG